MSDFRILIGADRWLQGVVTIIRFLVSGLYFLLGRIFSFRTIIDLTSFAERINIEMLDIIDSKKRRVENAKKSANHSKIYQPFRAIGYVTNEIPYVINNLGQDYFLTTCVGNSFQTYNVIHIVPSREH
jgi:hypothetical protein